MDLKRMFEAREYKKEDKTQIQEDAQSEKSVKQISFKIRKISQLLKNVETSNEKMIVSLIDMKQEKPQSEKSVKQINPESRKISELIKAIKNSSEKMIIPLIDKEKGKISYPILDQIGEPIDNVEFLEKLASEKFGILKRTIYERLIVCSDHPECLVTAVRLNCPHCTSKDISKLHLIEHKSCGYISENKNYEISDDGEVISCPSCKTQIRDANREIVKPAMWYTCNECKENFDEVSIKLHCRKAEHDFEISDAHTILIPSFMLKNLEDTSNSSISPILTPLKKLLDAFGFSTIENHTVIGKSGNTYHINIYGEDENKRCISIYIKNPSADSDNSELNSKIFQVLDTNTTITILIGFPSISEEDETIASNYNISLITEQCPEKIFTLIKNILFKKLSKLELEK